ITRPFAREKTKPKDWKDKMKDSKDAIEKVQKVEKEIEDMKRGLESKPYPDTVSQSTVTRDRYGNLFRVDSVKTSKSDGFLIVTPIASEGNKIGNLRIAK
ncbi:MAG: hypothetical protein AAF519_16950, partial [Bacteroidota bacterium]